MDRAASNGSGATPLLVPYLGNAVAEAVVAEWHIGVGDRVEVGTPVCDLETDKVLTGVEATFAGTVLELEACGATLAVGAPLAWFSTGHPVPASPESVDAANVVRIGAASIRLPEGRTASSPLARRLADELGVGLATVVGTGAGGRVRGDDVRNSVDPLRPTALTARLHVDVDMTRLCRRYDSAETAGGVPMLLAHIAWAAARALRDRPSLNAGAAATVNLGLASGPASTVRVVDRAETVVVEAFAAQLEHPSGTVAGSPSFTVWGFPSGVVSAFEPPVRRPEVAALGVGAVRQEVVAVVHDGQSPGLGVRPQVRLSLTIDAGSVDHLAAADYLEALRQLLEIGDLS